MKLHFLFISLFILNFSCQNNRELSGNKLIKDDLGREVPIKGEIKKVMALSSSITEMLYLVCEDEMIIGRTHNCNYPTQVLKKPVVSNYPIDYEKLLMLKPDLVFAKEGIISLEEALKIEEMGIPVYFQKYDKVEDVLSGLEKLGEILGREEQAKKAVDSLRVVLHKTESKVAGLSRPAVLMLISKEKIFVYGKDTYISDMLSKAGGRNAIDSIFNNPFPHIDTEYILKLNPDIIVGEEFADLNGSFFSMYPELKRTRAYTNKRIHSIPSDLTSRPGPRLIQGIDSLSKIIHPDAK